MMGRRLGAADMMGQKTWWEALQPEQKTGGGREQPDIKLIKNNINKIEQIKPFVLTTQKHRPSLENSLD